MKGYLGRPPEINDVRIMKVVQISSFNRNDRFIEGKPHFYPVAEQTEALCRIVFICFHHFPAFPAAFFLQFQRHVEMV